MRKRLVVIGLLGLAVFGCATHEPAARDGKAVGVASSTFRNRWWSHYERGCSYLSGSRYQEAEADFREAIKGRGRDSWQARTYGLHFVDYFPNRELGVACFQSGRLDEAQQYLEASLQQVDTERAHHYIDLVKRAKIAKGSITDSAAPAINITMAQAATLPGPTAAAAPPEAPAPVVEEKAAPAAAPKPAAASKKPAPPKPEKKAEPAKLPEPVPAAPKVEEKAPAVAAPAPVKEPAPAAPAQRVIVAERTLPLEVKASDDVGVASVSVNGQTLPQRGSAEQLTFADEVVLKEGTHEIAVSAEDLSDKKVEQKVEVTVDLTGPTIGVFAPADPTVTEDASARLEGVSVDQNGVVSVALSERVLAESPGDPRMDFDTDLPLGNGENSFIIVAKDVAGNETRSAVKVFRGSPDSMAAKLWLIKQKAPHLLQYAANGWPEMSIALDTLAATEEPVTINLKSPDPGQPYRHNRTLRISGDVISQTKVASVSINGEVLEPLTGAPKESFNKRIPIDVPETQGGAKVTVTIAATDDAGNTKEMPVEVVVRPVQMNSQVSKMPVAVLAFTGNGIEAPLAEMLRVDAEGKIGETKRFRVLDRTQLQAVLTEQDLAALADPTQALRLGKVVNAQVFVVADVFPRDQAGLEIKARAIRTETTDIVATLDVFVDDKANRDKVVAACADLAAQMVKAFPRLSGQILAVKAAADGAELFVDWTEEDGVHEGMYMLVVKEEPPVVDDATGEVLQEGEVVEVARGQIDRVTPTSTKAREVKQGEKEPEIVKGMAAITM